jgi:hypothetical protein
MPTAANWRIAAASVRGTSHEASDAPCQDAHRTEILAAKTDAPLVIAVSDGAGSARVSEIGARIAVTAICEQAEAWFASGHTIRDIDRSVFVGWLSGVREQIAERAAESLSEMRDFACTLLIAIIGSEEAAFAQLGDGAIVVLTKEQEWSWIFWPQHGPYANTTNFITEDSALERFECEVGSKRRIDEVAVFTDGIEQLVLDHKGRAAHDPFFNRMFPPLRESLVSGADTELSKHLAGYLTSPTVTGRTNDDATLVLASRRAPVPEVVVEVLSEPSDVRNGPNSG